MNRQRGYAYLDVLVATAVLLVCLVPAMSSLHSANQTQQQAETSMHLAQHVSSKMAMVLARGKHQLNIDVLNSTDLSDPIGDADRRLVTISYFDGDNADGDGDISTGVDDELIYIQVSLHDGRFRQETLVSLL